MLTLGQAATEAGVSKATISRAIKSGRLSAVRSDGCNSFAIDPAELFRVYRRNDRNGATKQTATPRKMAEAHLKAEIEGLRAQLTTMRELANELKGQRDAWQCQAEASQRLLSDQWTQQRWVGRRKAV